MSSSTPPRAGKKPNRSAKAKLAEQRRRQQRAEQRRRIFIALGSVIALGAIVGGLVAVKLTSGNKSGSSTTTVATKAAPAAVVSNLTKVPAATLDSAGTGGSPYPSPIKGGAALTKGGKPDLVYVGAEYCPYCGAMRWPLTIALSRFGTFSNLHVTHSSRIDHPSYIPTLTFYKSTYTSPYLTFTPVEETTANVVTVNGQKTYKPLQTPTKAQEQLVQRYDTSGGIPFLDFANKAVWTGAPYDPTIIQKLSWEQIAQQANAGTTTAGKTIDQWANKLTASICLMTGNNPGSVCNTSTISGLEKTISAQKPVS